MARNIDSFFDKTAFASKIHSTKQSQEHSFCVTALRGELGFVVETLKNTEKVCGVVVSF
jgi:hypothetical protein